MLSSVTLPTTSTMLNELTEVKTEADRQDRWTDRQADKAEQYALASMAEAWVNDKIINSIIRE